MYVVIIRDAHTLHVAGLVWYVPTVTRDYTCSSGVVQQMGFTKEHLWKQHKSTRCMSICTDNIRSRYTTSKYGTTAVTAPVVGYQIFTLVNLPGYLQ